jgi:tripartite-type tricarboxylate transporter receptor subunit TctC
MKRSARRFQLTAPLAVALVTAAGGACAQTASSVYPAKTIRIIVPVVPGGGLDAIVRLISAKLSENLRQSVVVDNRPGASGTIGLETLARAAPDGYTLGALSSSQVISAALTRTSYDLFRDFAPVTQAAAAPYVLVVHPALNVSSVAELVDVAKANPGKLNYASAGNGTLQHLATELFATSTGIRLAQVPYKGVGGAFPDLLSNRVQMTLSSMTALGPHMRSKALRGLAVTSAQRTKDFPELPTMLEAGIRGFVVTQWHGVLAPSATPRRLVERVQREIANVVQQPEMAARLEKDSTDPVGSSPQAFAALLKEDDARWRGVIRAIGLRAAD